MEFANDYVKCHVTFDEKCRHIKIKGVIYNRHQYKTATLIAPNSANLTSSFSGSALPYPCADIAFEGTPNIFKIIDDEFSTVFTYPNSYYTVAVKEKIVSSIFFVLEDQYGHENLIRFQLPDLYPLRTLVDRKNRTGPEFYEIKNEILPIDTAEIVMKEYAKIKLLYDIA
jgi:hypothetical protein